MYVTSRTKGVGVGPDADDWSIVGPKLLPRADVPKHAVPNDMDARTPAVSGRERNNVRVDDRKKCMIVTCRRPRVSHKTAAVNEQLLAHAT